MYTFIANQRFSLQDLASAKEKLEVLSGCPEFKILWEGMPVQHQV